jgi:putative peptidoglycan lipid II flippase
LQFAIQLPALFRSGYRFVPRLDLRFRDPGLRQILKMMAPATVGLMATQVNIYINSEFASSENGAATWLYFAFRLLQLPIGMFGVAVGTVALTRFARSSADLEASKDAPRAGQGAELEAALLQVRDTLRRGLRMVSFLTVPTGVGLFLLAEPIIRAIYQHGAFHRADTEATASALRYYAVGLSAYAAVKVVAPVFYALRLPRIAVTASVLAVLANVVFNVALHPHYGFRVLALGTSVAAVVNLGYLLSRFQARYGGLWQGGLAAALGQIVTASSLMGIVVFALDRGYWMLLGRLGLPPSTVATLIDLSLVIPVGGAAYGGLCWLMGMEEMTTLLDRVRSRLRRRRPLPPPPAKG